MICLKKARDLTPAHRLDSLRTSEILLREAGVKVTMIEDPIGYEMPFNGEKV